MITIYKYPIIPGYGGFVDVQGTVIQWLKIDEQGDTYQVWAVVNIEDDAPIKKYVILAVGTGWELKHFEKMEYIDTAQEGPYVWHYFAFEDKGEEVKDVDTET